MRSKNKVTGFFVYATAVLFVTVFQVGAALNNPAFAKTANYTGTPAKYVFLFIGDGMGIPQITAAEKYVGKELLIQTFPAQGITSTYAADRFITGSAASATALAAGQKTNIGMIGMAPDQRHVKTVAEMAKEKGMKVGIISSVSIDHATPAAFYAHVPSRSQYYDIDVQLAESGFDFFGGGGLKDPTDKKKKSKAFKGDALEIAKKNGYKIVNNKSDFMKLTSRSGKVIVWNANLPDGKAMPYVLDQTSQDITLPEFTAKAIEMLDNPKGFFITVEGGKIDWACHANDATSSITNTLAFDYSIQKAVEFAKRHPGETLIVVTGDHECGGLTLGFAGTQYDSHFDILGKQNISFQKFTDEVLKGYKDQCGGNHQFSDVKPLITKHFGLKFQGDLKADNLVLEQFQVDQLRDAFNKSMGGEKEGSENSETYLLYGEYDPLTVSITHILNQKAGLGWTSYKHTGVPVATTATGVGAEIFNGYYDNTDVAMKIMSVMGITSKVHYASCKNDEALLAANY
jgi:alkaline phosphatase